MAAPLFNFLFLFLFIIIIVKNILNISKKLKKTKNIIKNLYKN
tara:strand:- start:9165 stop:9293 length:129 start_codon:yes stop_codon:yes gene_type:complete